MGGADAKYAIEIIAAATIPLSIVALLVNRTVTGKSMTVRALQFVALTTILPIVLILALESILERSAAGALTGALVGYFFSNIGKYDERLGAGEKE